MKFSKQKWLLIALLFVSILIVAPNSSVASTTDNVNPDSVPSYAGGETATNASDRSVDNPSLYAPEPSKKKVTKLQDSSEKTSTPQTSQAPEPTTLLLLGSGIVGLISLRKRTQKYLSSSHSY